MRTRALIAGTVLATSVGLTTISTASPASATSWPGHPDRDLVTYTIQPGDTLYGLATRYHAWTNELLSVNNLKISSILRIGQRVVIPVVVSRAATAPSSNPAPVTTAPVATASPTSTTSWPGHPDRNLVTYTIQRGDTLYGLATRYHAWTNELLSINNLKTSSILRIGQRVVIPVVTSRAATAPSNNPAPPTTAPSNNPAPPTTAPSNNPAPPTTAPVPAPVSATDQAIAAIQARYAFPGATAWPGHPDRIVITHLVQPGETIYRLAVQYHAWTSEIASINGIQYTVRGQVVKIPIVVSASNRARDAEIAQVAPGTQPTYAQSMDAAGWRDYTMTRSQVRQVIVDTAQSNGVDPTLALAVAWQESGWHQPVTSPAGALGVMQVMPATASWMSAYAGRTLNPRATGDNVLAGVLFLKYLTRLAGADHSDQIMAGYYQGMTAIGQNPRWFDDTKKYVASVSAIYDNIRAGKM